MNAAIERCPQCGKQHTRGRYENRPDSPAVQPRDIKCGCGLTLHWSVPIFKTSESGYVLRVLRDDETPFL